MLVPLPESVQRALVKEADPGSPGELMSASLHPGGSPALRVWVEVRERKRANRRALTGGGR
jgi:hypothetical protein